MKLDTTQATVNAHAKPVVKENDIARVSSAKEINSMQKKKNELFLYARTDPTGEKKGFGWHTKETAKEHREQGWLFDKDY